MFQLDIEIVERARRVFSSGKTLPYSFRRKQLKNLLRFYKKCEEEILTALHKDLRKCKQDALLTELMLMKADIRDILRNFKKYTGNESVSFNWLTFNDSAYVKKDPFGVVLILGTWNFPFVTTLKPLAGAIAAGNCVIIKPSEVSPHSAETMGRLLPLYLDQECYQIFMGGLEETQLLLTNKFDYIFATGSVNVGKSIMAAAVNFLTPVTLELGGKNPVYIDESSDIGVAVKRILLGKFLNNGQVCLSPDYVICNKKIEALFIEKAKEILLEWYGEDPQLSPDYGRIVNARHFERLLTLLQGTEGTVEIGGNYDSDDLYIAPTIITGVEISDIFMEDEIFGPFLPILNCETTVDAIQLILSKPKSLALYVFSQTSSVIKMFLNKTSTGGMCINDTCFQYTYEGLPFGGVGNSGMGNYHGKYSVDTFCHKKAVVHRGQSFLTELQIEPRYPKMMKKLWMAKLFTRFFFLFNVNFKMIFTHFSIFIIGLLTYFVFDKYLIKKINTFIQKWNK